jgi:hypothetical protein
VILCFGPLLSYSFEWDWIQKILLLSSFFPILSKNPIHVKKELYCQIGAIVMKYIFHSFTLNTNMNCNEWYFLCQNEIEWEQMRANDIYSTWMKVNNILNDIYFNEQEWELQHYALVDHFLKFNEKWLRNDPKMTRMKVKFLSWISMTNITCFHVPLMNSHWIRFSETILFY